MRGRFALAQISLVEGLVRVATLSEFTRHSSHKAHDDFLHSGEASELG
jgi:hypothetical protein